MNGDSAKIAIYDVRGIQEYIFRTNAVKEIVGGSKIVDNLIITEFENACRECKDIEESEIVLDWYNHENYKFDTDTNIKIEVLYYGGGNLVVLFRTEELCKNVSIIMSKNIMKKAYGLSLAYAFVSKTENYNDDWKNLKQKLSEIKAVTPLNKPAGILPIVQYDAISGRPLSKIYNNKKVTYEAYQKLKKYEEVQKEETQYVKEFDKMRTSKEEGLIAIVHIDGNSMGMNIRDILKDSNTYSDAVSKMRKISKDIHEVFEIKAINTVKEKIIDICKKHNIKANEKEIPFRPLIQAGDDITFVCNERIALDIVKEYINSIREGYMFDEKYKFSACGGIAIIHSHYPFYKGYQVAEECCKNAKKRAKAEGRVDGKIGNFVDFEYCYSGAILDLENSRKENYTSIDGNSLLKKPYGIYTQIIENNSKKEEVFEENLNDEQKSFSLKTFEDDLKALKGISRSTAKLFRDSYYESKSTIEINLLKYGAKNKKQFKKAFTNIAGKQFAEYYDALEMLDIFGTKEGKE